MPWRYTRLGVCDSAAGSVLRSSSWKGRAPSPQVFSPRNRVRAGELLGPPAGGGDSILISSQCDNGDVMERQSGGKTTSPVTGYNSPSLAEWGAAEAKAKRGGASDRSASRPLSLQAGAELTLSEALIAGPVVKKMTNCKIKFKKKCFLVYGSACFFL